MIMTKDQVDAMRLLSEFDRSNDSAITVKSVSAKEVHGSHSAPSEICDCYYSLIG